MRKLFVTLTFFIALSAIARAQSGSLIYFLTNSGKLVSTKDSADYWMLVNPPDSSINKDLYSVREYYKNGQLKLVAGSKTNDINLLYEGRYISYYSNGRRMRTGTFKGGDPTGLETSYYPNSKVSTIKRYDDNGLFLSQCSDSTGKVITQNGNGKWIEFDETLKDTVAAGEVKHGLRDGEWHGRLNSYENYINVYHNGRRLSSKTIRRKLASGEFAAMDTVPHYPGGEDAFLIFLSKNVRYPKEARESRIQGKVIVLFVVEADGTLTNIKVLRSVGSGCDEEAMRIIKLSSPWVPGMKNGKPDRVAYSVPVSFKSE